MGNEVNKPCPVKSVDPSPPANVTDLVVRGYHCLTVNYKDSGVEAVSSLSYASIEEGLEELRNIVDGLELVYLQTCNRVEVYVYGGEAEDKLKRVAELFRGRLGTIDAKLRVLKGWEVVDHLFRVAAGLDSMLLGENEVLGQVRRAFLAADKAGCLGRFLRLLFVSALRAGRSVRRLSGLSSHGFSLPKLAVDYVDRAYDLRDRRVLVLGAGTAGGLVARRLKNKGCSEVVVANRSFDRAVRLASRYSFRPAKLDEAVREMCGFDVVFVTAPIPGLKDFVSACNGHMVLVDLSSSLVNKDGLSGIIELVTIDDLRLDALRLRGLLSREVSAAEEAINSEVRKFGVIVATLLVRDLLKEVFVRADEIRRGELGRAVKKLDLSPEELNVLDAMTKSIVKKVLYPVVRSTYELARSGDVAEAIGLLSRLVGG